MGRADRHRTKNDSFNAKSCAEFLKEILEEFPKLDWSLGSYDKLLRSQAVPRVSTGVSVV